MTKPRVLLAGLFVLVLSLAACGPSGPPPEEQPAAANTPAPTSTPLPPTETPTEIPTPTATPIPYDLMASVVDADGSPIAGAVVSLAELGEGDAAAQTTDETGQVSWADLPGEAASLAASAPGYFAAEESATLERGPNEVSITLERDPFGLLPAAACAPGETLLYIEDFQDGQAQGWPELEFAAMGWSIGPDPEQSEDTVVIATGQAGDDQLTLSTRLADYVFDNAVWRIQVKIVGGDVSSFLNWRHSFETGDWRYIIHLGPQVFVDLSRLQMPERGGIGVGVSSSLGTADVWHAFEISAFEGTIQVWMDGQQLIDWTDPQPLPPGTIGLEPHIWSGEGTLYYNNIAVCELAAPFAPMPTPEPEE